MMEQNLTYYAPAERSSNEEIMSQLEVLMTVPFINELLSSVAGIAAIVNKNRQVIYANDSLFDMLGVDDCESFIGLRPGEILGCIHSQNTTGGCGTSKYCRYCGGVNAILDSQKTGKQSVKECRLSVKSDESIDCMDLMIKATPLVVAGETFIILSIVDISDKKRKEALERIFYHDVINMAGGINNLVALIKDSSLLDKKDYEELVNTLYTVSNELIEEILAQRDLAMAENNELNIKPEAVDAKELVHTVTSLFRAHEVGKDKRIDVVVPKEEVLFVTDRLILNRVLGNLLKNALEASEINQIVTMELRRNQNIEFIVRNLTCMPEEVKKQLFKRSFSTKGVGRGLGSYSVKLLTERYLKGTVHFSSDMDKGTEFHVLLPETI